MEHKTENQNKLQSVDSKAITKSPEEIVVNHEQHSETHEKHSPLDQFKVKEIYPIHVGNLNLSLTNSALYMIIATALIILFMIKATSRKLLIPSRTQVIAESVYNFINNLIEGSIGQKVKNSFH